MIYIILYHSIWLFILTMIGINEKWSNKVKILLIVLIIILYIASLYYIDYSLDIFFQSHNK